MRDLLYAEVRAEVEALRSDIAKAWLRSIVETVTPVLELDEMLEIVRHAVCAEVMNS